MSTKINIVIAKRVSSKGNTYLSGSIKCGNYSNRDFFFPNINAVQELTGKSIAEIESSDCGVLFDKEIEVK